MRPSFTLALIVMGFLALGVMYIRALPLFEGHDEAEHLIYVHHLLETGELPVIQSREQVDTQDDPIQRWNNESHQPPLYYLLAAPFISGTSRDDLDEALIPNQLIFLRNTTADNVNKWLHPVDALPGDTRTAVDVLRGVNLVIGAGTLVLAYLAAQQIFPLRHLVLLVPFALASIPTFIMIATTVTNDMLLTFLYSAGILWTVRVWRHRAIRPWDTGTITLILAGTALTKLTGLSLFGVVFGVVLLGAWTKRWQWRTALQVIVVSLIGVALLAGWWYGRNFDLYGDPFAMTATQSVWGRDVPLTLDRLPAEVLHIARSFWAIVGSQHQPVYAPDALYVYLAIITAIAVIGLARWARHESLVWLLVLPCVLVFGTLLYGTRNVDISVGRLLAPTFIAFLPLLFMGWHRITRRGTFLLILPLTVYAVSVPLVVMPAVYPRLDGVDAVPDSAVAVNARVDDLEVLAIEFPQVATLQPGQDIDLALYIRGAHPRNPALTITAVDSVRVARLDHVEIYPGMAPTSALPPDDILRVPIQMQLATPGDIRSPRIVMFLIEWVDLDDQTRLMYDTEEPLLEVPGTTFLDPRYEPPATGDPIATFTGDGTLALTDIALQEQVAAGDSLGMALTWNPQSPFDHEWTVVVQMTAPDGEVIVEHTHDLWFYPSPAWLADIAFQDTIMMAVPSDVASGAYTVRLTWERETGTGDVVRLMQGDSAFVTLGTVQVLETGD